MMLDFNSETIYWEQEYQEQKYVFEKNLPVKCNAPVRSIEKLFWSMVFRYGWDQAIKIINDYGWSVTK